MSRAVGHVKVPKLTSIERRDPKLHVTWQRVDAHAAPYLNLNLVYKITHIYKIQTLVINYNSLARVVTLIACCICMPCGHG
jgi:hypothetical protein